MKTSPASHREGETRASEEPNPDASGNLHAPCDRKAWTQPVEEPNLHPVARLIPRVADDLDLLRKTFPFESTPAAAAIQNGVQKELLVKFDASGTKDHEPLRRNY